MTSLRSADLQRFLELTCAAIARRTSSSEPAGCALAAVRRLLAKPPASPGSATSPCMFPACQYLPDALAIARRNTADLAEIAEVLATLSPRLAWCQHAGNDKAFMDGHVDAPIVGPEAGALEYRDDVRVGVSLMAPGVTYPDHKHPPEEVYIVLSGGAWRQKDGPWHEPGIGGIVYNPPNIVHAMRSGSVPLLAIWCLPAADAS